MNALRLSLALLVICLSACTTPLPDEASLDRYEAQALQLAQHDIALLDAQLAAGKITAYEHKASKEALLANVHNRAVDAAWTAHSIDQKHRKTLGLPTPDNLQQINVPLGNALPTGSQRQAFNSGDQTLGGMGNPQQVKQFFSGYSPGNAVRGNNSGF